MAKEEEINTREEDERKSREAKESGEREGP